MTLTPTTLLIVLLGAAVGGAVVLLVRSLVGFPVDDRVAESGGSLADKIHAAGRQVPFAIGAFLLVLLLTRWLVVAIGFHRVSVRLRVTRYLTVWAVST